MAEEVTTATGDMFGEFGEFDLGGEEFGGESRLLTFDSGLQLGLGPTAIPGT